MIAPFRMVSTSSGENRMTCAGCRCENIVFVCFFSAGIKFNHRPKVSRGHSLHQLTWKLTPMGTWVRLDVQNFSPIGARGGNAAPKSQKFPHFGKESSRRGQPVDRFLQLSKAFMRQLPSISVDIWGDSLHWLRSYCWETARQSFNPNFSVHPVGKICVGSKID